MAKKKAKRRTKTPIREGELWAVPIPRMGYCPLVVTREPGENAEVDFAYAYLLPALFDELPKPGDIPPLKEWTSAWMGLISTRPLRNERWKPCGLLSEFNRTDWPVPPTRRSVVDESEPRKEWGKKPWGEMWSIETTADEPTMTLIANNPTTRDEALRFPIANVVTAASAFEKTLAHHFKGRRPGFWDMDINLNNITPKSLKSWINHGNSIRRKLLSKLPDWLPAGRKTDRQLKAGAWMGLPLYGGGFGAALLISKLDSHERFFSDAAVYGMRRRWDTWPTLEDVINLTPDDGALLVQTSMICVRDGRWRVLGYMDSIDPREWVRPLIWSMKPIDNKKGLIEVSTKKGRITIQVDPNILRLAPEAGKLGQCSSGYTTVELDIPRILDNTNPDLNDTFPYYKAITPEKLDAWRKINTAIEQALESNMK